MRTPLADARGSVSSRDRVPSRARKRAALLVPLLLTGCGYHVAGTADTIPKNIQTIAVPPFKNLTVRYKLTDYLAQSVSREFISRGRFLVVPDETKADAVLNGAVISYVSFPVIADQRTGRATAIQLIVTMQVSLINRATKDILFSRPTFDFKQRYEISVDQQAYFEESNAGLQRLSADVGRDIVSAILENF